jgi:4-hydroxybenzoate polyprenyltransferase
VFSPLDAPCFHAGRVFFAQRATQGKMSAHSGNGAQHEKNHRQEPDSQDYGQDYGQPYGAGKGQNGAQQLAQASIDRVKNQAKRQLSPLVRAMRLNKPTGFFLSVLPGLWGWTACWPLGSWADLGHLVCGAFWARALGCLYNDWVDRDMDAQVLRTHARPFACGQTLGAFSRALVGFLIAGPAAFWVWVLPWPAGLLGIGAGLGTLLYPWAKRFFACPQIILALVFNLGVVMAPLLVPIVPWRTWVVCGILYAGACCWTLVYDTVYAFQDYADDRRLGLGSLAVGLGFGRARPVLLALVFARYALVLMACCVLVGPGLIDRVAPPTAIILMCALSGLLGLLMVVEMGQIFRLPFGQSDLFLSPSASSGAQGLEVSSVLPGPASNPQASTSQASTPQASTSQTPPPQSSTSQTPLPFHAFSKDSRIQGQFARVFSSAVLYGLAIWAILVVVQAGACTSQVSLPAKWTRAL